MAIPGRFGGVSLLSAVEVDGRQVQALSQRQSEASEGLRAQLSRAVELLEDSMKELRREAEKVAREVERRVLGRQEELETRFEAYVRHFDGSVNSIHMAVLGRGMLEATGTLVPAAVQRSQVGGRFKRPRSASRARTLSLISHRFHGFFNGVRWYFMLFSH